MATIGECTPENHEQRARIGCVYCTECGKHLKAELKKLPLIQCPNCRMSTFESWDHCYYCGHLLGKTRCPRCRTPILDTWQYCSYCGHRLRKHNEP